MNAADVLIVGAGPAGMAAAVEARRHGLEVVVVDEQATPGGQIWRSVEATEQRDAILGPTYIEGRNVAAAFRASGARYEPGAQIWKIETGFRAYVSRDRQPMIIDAKAVILATGAQERPVPFPGWTLPGVLTVGAAQILLKNAGQIPADPVWIAGSGPLPLLYMTQLLRAGGQIAGFLNTTPAGQWRSAVRHLPGALRSAGDLLKGLGWSAALRARNTPIVSGVTDIEALGDGRIQRLRYRTKDGVTMEANASALLVHEGVVPNLHVALSLDCEIAWVPGQDCFSPIVDNWGESSQANIFIVGDGAGIAGAKAALLRGELAAIRVAAKFGKLSERAASVSACTIRGKLDRQLAIRPFLDALFKPRPQIFAPPDATIVCRCEEITAGALKEFATIGQPGPIQIKAATRAGMGPCQGRQCGYTVTRILSAAQGRSPAEVGFFHVRPPLKPVTLGELAALNEVLNPSQQTQPSEQEIGH